MSANRIAWQMTAWGLLMGGLLGGIALWGQQPPLAPPDLSPEQLREIDTIRQRLGSVVPNEGPLGTGTPETATPRTDGVGPTCLPAGDPLVPELAALSRRLEQRARQEAGSGHWSLGISLHELSQHMQRVSNLTPQP